MPPGGSTSAYGEGERGSEASCSTGPMRAFQRFLWPFCVLASSFFLKKRKQHQIILPAALPPEPNLSSCLHFSEVTNYVSGNCFLQGSNFCLHMRCPPPAEMLAALWPGWVIRRMSQGMASTLCQGNRFAACSEDKFFTRGKLWHEFLWKK